MTLLFTKSITLTISVKWSLQQEVMAIVGAQRRGCGLPMLTTERSPTGALPMLLSFAMTRSKLWMARKWLHSPPEGRSCVVHGKMLALLGRSCQTSRYHTLFRSLSSIATGMADEPAFNRWVLWVLKKRVQIVSLVKS